MATSTGLLMRLTLLVVITTCSLLALLFSYLGFVFVSSELYFPLWPSIDTRYAPGFSEAKFDCIQVGMDSAQVAAMLGEPYSKYNYEDWRTQEHYRMWAYTGDGAAVIFDFAWLGREVQFDKAGKVTARVRNIYYD